MAMREPIYTIDPERFALLLEQLRLSGRKVAKATGISQAMISKIACGTTNVSDETLGALSGVLARLGGFNQRQLEVWLCGGASAPTGSPIIYPPSGSH